MDVTYKEELQFIVRSCRKIRPPATVWMGGAALGTDGKYVWIPSGVQIPKDQLEMKDPSQRDHGYCVRLHWNTTKPTFTIYDCEIERWYVCKY